MCPLTSINDAQCLPYGAFATGDSFVIHDRKYRPLVRFAAHEDQDEPCEAWGNLDLPGGIDCFTNEGCPAFIRVRPETAEVVGSSEWIDHDENESVWFFRDVPGPDFESLQALVDRFPELGVEIQRRNEKAAAAAKIEADRREFNDRCDAEYNANITNFHAMRHVEQMARPEAATAQAPVPMIGGTGEMQVKHFGPIFDAVPRVNRSTAHPTMPLVNHPLYDKINAAIPGIIATQDAEAIAAIMVVHPDTAKLLGEITPQIEARARILEGQYSRELMQYGARRFSTDARNRIESDNPDNVRALLDGLKIEVRWNEWTERIELRGWKWNAWTEISDSAVATLMTRAAQTELRFVMAKDFAWRTLEAIAHENGQDPARDFLDDCEARWDGQSRGDTWLCDACGVPDNEYYRAVSRLVLLGLVGRIRQPGLKFDFMPVLVSPMQGTSKSTLARVLALNGDWFSESVRLGDEAKELVLALAGKSVVEISEMRSRGEIEAVKAMLSRTHDEARAPYGRAITKRPRRNIFIGSTNNPEFLDDATGNRRFLPIHVVGEIKIEWVQENLHQLVGEAAALHSRGASPTLPRNVWEIAAEYQEGARIKSDAEIQLHEWFGGNQEGYITSGDLAELARLCGWSRNNAARGAIMRSLGFREENPRIHGKRGRVWVRGNLDAAQFVVVTTGGSRPRIGTVTSTPMLPCPIPLPR